MKYGPFCDFYGLNFKEHIAIDNSLKYSAVENGNFDVMVVYATDGLNRKAGLKVLEDDLGFFPEYNGALLVREVPADIDAADTVPTLEEFAERLRTGRSPDEKREALLHTMACKAAIKGGWVSDPAELRVLVDRVQSGEIKYCPHGRPVAVKLTKYELEKMFKRA